MEGIGVGIFIFIIVIVILAVVVYLVLNHNNPKPGPKLSDTCPSTDSSPLYYGTQVKFVNYGEFDSNKNVGPDEFSMSVCGNLKHKSVRYNVSTSKTPKLNSNVWIIADSQGNINTTQPINYGDTVQLINQYGDKTKMAATGSTMDCGTNVVTVSTETQNSEVLWKIEPSLFNIGQGNPGQVSSRTSGQVQSCDVIGIRSVKDGKLVSVCGFDDVTSECNGFNISLPSKKLSGTKRGVEQWIIVSNSTN